MAKIKPPDAPQKKRTPRKKVATKKSSRTRAAPPTRTSFANQFLIAMPAMEDPNFEHTVTYICEHGPHGALGIVINRQVDITLKTVFEHMQIDVADPRKAELPVFMGGPVQGERGFVLHSPTGEWGSTVYVTDDLAITTSRDILEALAAGGGPENVLVALGYAGWGPGQLEHEITQNAWLTGPADPRVIFETPVEQRWRAAAKLMGIDLALLQRDAGHA